MFCVQLCGEFVIDSLGEIMGYDPVERTQPFYTDNKTTGDKHVTPVTDKKPQKCPIKVSTGCKFKKLYLIVAIYIKE